MPFQCRLIELDELRASGEKPKPGDMWYAPWYLRDDGTPSDILSPEYYRDWADKRPPLVIWLPCNHAWIVDMRFMENGEPQERGWEVIGEIPNITALPSVLMPEYHGWLQNGLLSDDLEGRTY